MLSGLAVLSGCGDSRGSDIPPALLEAIAQQGTGAVDDGYAAGPYGSEAGSVARNLCFEGWQNPAEANLDVGEFEQICFADFYDPEASVVRLLYVSTAAAWCIACQNEYGGGGAARPSLGAQLGLRLDRGFRVLGTFFQDTERNPATPEDVRIWAQAFQVDFPFVVDDDFKMGLFANANNQPFGMLIDTRDMTILSQFEGDVPASLWPAVDTFLGDTQN